MITYLAMPTEEARKFQAGAPDAYGLAAGTPRVRWGRSSLPSLPQDVGAGEEYLILAYRPFPALQPYAETGPIFLHAKACARADDAHETPAMLARRAAHLIKGYSTDDRIVYGTGKIVPSADLDTEAANILKRDDVAYVHVRSSVNNCYSCRIERA